MRAAAIQLNSTADVDRNLATAERLVDAAAAAGAELVVLPEKWSALGPGEMLLELAEPLDGPIVTAARGWAQRLGITLLAGSVGERIEGSERIANTSLLIAPDGEIEATYRKIHMFDVDVGGVSYRESEHERAGEEVVVAPAAGTDLGMTICYDLRFPELFRILALRGARVITVPSAFTATTGRDHWEVLLRARAIEDQLFVVAANQFGTAPPSFSSWGHSMIVDPWGRILDVLADGEGHAIADLDLGEVERVRAQVPSLASRRDGAYAWPVEAGDRA
ncbi:MAG TPA: carbon-nitrogen hydrolase family protein [Solirubrobacterales bacterium]|jgi:predicted amidohydrolase|nr:carbon-nitrogen hydrolase family protein [Solirubrobacterales bacterium]